MAGPEGKVNMYHHLVEALKFAVGQRWRLWDPYSHPGIQVKLLGSDGVLSPSPEYSMKGEGQDWSREGVGILCSSRQGSPSNGSKVVDINRYRYSLHTG